MTKRPEFEDADKVVRAFEQAAERAEREGVKHAVSRPIEDHLGDWGITCSCGWTSLGWTERKAVTRALAHLKGASQ